MKQETHVWQHNFIGAQMFIYHKDNQEQAFDVLIRSLPQMESDNWVYLGTEIILL